MAAFVFDTAATWTRRIPGYLRGIEFGANPGWRSRHARIHDVRGGTPGTQQTSQLFHGWIDSAKEVAIARAQVVQAGLPVWGNQESIPWAFAVAGEAHLALPTIVGQRVSLGITKALL